MIRTTRGLALMLVAAVLATGPAGADTLTDTVVAQLQAQGYRSITVGNTFLGRLRIVARGPSVQREIVLDPNTGEILRDYERVERQMAGTNGGDQTHDRGATVGSVGEGKSAPVLDEPGTPSGGLVDQPGPMPVRAGTLP